MRYLVLFLMMVGSVFGALAGTYAGGDGSAGSPAQIANATQLNSLMDTTADWAAGFYFILTGDPDLSAAGTENPIGTAAIPFNGTFDGDGHTISATVVNDAAGDCQGLFGCIGPSGVVYDLTVTGSVITGGTRTGGLVGWNQGLIYGCVSTNPTISADDYWAGGFAGQNTGMIRDCSATVGAGGTVSRTATGAVAGGFVGENGYEKVGGGLTLNAGTIVRCFSTIPVLSLELGEIGGFVGYNCGTILSCYSTGTVTCQASAGTASVGGFVGNGNGGLYSQCYSTGLVTTGSGVTSVGGFAGENTGGHASFTNCYATGNVVSTGTNSKIGGFIGMLSNASLYHCYTTSEITTGTTGDYVGGFVGMLEGINGSITTITDCYAKGSVSGNQYVGGFIGQAKVTYTVTRCYCTGVVVAVSDGGSFVAHSTTDSYTACYWNSTTTVEAHDAGGAGVSGLTTAQMGVGANFTDWTFDAVGAAPLNWHITAGYPAFYLNQYLLIN